MQEHSGLVENSYNAMLRSDILNACVPARIVKYREVRIATKSSVTVPGRWFALLDSPSSLKCRHGIH